jgi:hypothetical protein
MLLVNSGTEALGCPSQAGHELSGIDRAARNVFCNSQSAGIVPGNRGIVAATLARDFPCTAKVEIAIHFQRAKNFLETGEDVAETGHVSRGSLSQRHAAGAAARARAYRECFENGNGFLRREPLEPRGCGKPGEPTADDGKIGG